MNEQIKHRHFQFRLELSQLPHGRIKEPRAQSAPLNSAGNGHCDHLLPFGERRLFRRTSASGDADFARRRRHFRGKSATSLRSSFDAVVRRSFSLWSHEWTR